MPLLIRFFRVQAQNIKLALLTATAHTHGIHRDKHADGGLGNQESPIIKKRWMLSS